MTTWLRYDTAAVPRLLPRPAIEPRPSWAEWSAAEKDRLVFERHARLPGLSVVMRRHCERRAAETAAEAERLAELRRQQRERETPADWREASGLPWTWERVAEYGRWCIASFVLACLVVGVTTLLCRAVWWAWPVR